MPPDPESARSPVPGPPTPTATPIPALRLATGPIASLDPLDLDTPDALQVASQVFDGLVEIDPETADVVPAVAERWDVLDDGRRLVFRLRQGLTFHDGSPLTAASFVAAWNRLADPVAAAPFAFLLESVEGFQRFQEELKVTRLSGVNAPAPRTLEVRLSRSWPDFVSLLAHPALSPVPAPAPAETFATQPNGNGPYRVVGALTPGSPIRLTSFSGYRGVPPGIGAIEYLTFDAPEDAWPEFLAGELDVAEIPAGVLAEATSRFGDRGVASVARVLYCAFNQDDERFRDPSLRVAVSMSIDRRELVESVYARLPEPATGVVPPRIPGHVAAACGARCVHDPEAAGSLARGLPRASRTFSLDYAASPAGDRLAALLTEQMGSAGLRVTPRPQSPEAFERVLGEGQHEMFCLAWIADSPRQQAFLEPLLAGGSVDNRAGVEDPRLDQLLEEARTALDPHARERLYAEAERHALSRMHVIPLVWFRSHLAAQPEIEGFTVDALGRYDVASLSISG